MKDGCVVVFVQHDAEKRKAADAVALGWCKAFNTVLQHILISKLEKDGDVG